MVHVFVNPHLSAYTHTLPLPTYLPTYPPTNTSLSFSRDTPRPTTPLDCIKFLCKDLWTLLFRKQIDNLKTNHRGVFVLTDQRFQPISRVSVDRKAGVKAPEETLSRAQAVSFT